MTINRRFLKVGLVAFIDLLGFSARVEALATGDDLERLVQDVRRVQLWFDHRPDDDTLKQSQKITGKVVLAFSDCIVACVPVQSQVTRVEGVFDVFMSELTSFAMAQGRCAVNGIFLRGGADFGMWYRRKDTLISPAMVNAYRLEGQACVPMIALTGDLYRHLAEHPHRGFYSESIDPIPRVLRRYENLPNGSSQWFIDYLPICLEAMDGSIAASDRAAYNAGDADTKDRMKNEAFLRDCHQWTGRHRDAIRTALAAAGTGVARSKYVWLAVYHDEAVTRFYGTPPVELLIGEV